MQPKVHLLTVKEKMKLETFNQLMLAEWENKTLKPYQKHCETKYFNLLWDLRENLYDFFHPLGISTNGIHDVCHVASAFSHAEYDDGDLSIVVARTSYPFDKSESLSDLMKEINVDYQAEILKHVTVFVMFGYHSELTSERVAVQATRHSPDNKLHSFHAKRFDLQALKKLHSFIPRFNEERNLCKNMSDADNYFKYKTETLSLIEKMILDL